MKPADMVDRDEPVYELRLYVMGESPRTRTAIRNLARICSDHLAGRYHIEVIDLAKSPQLAKGDQIVAIPTLVRQLPPPLRKVIGDLSNTEKVLVGLDLKPRAAIPADAKGSSAPENRD